MSAAEKWGLPADFKPIRFAIDDHVKDVVSSVLQANEPVVITITNVNGNIALVGTNKRLFSIKTSDVGGAGVTGAQMREFPWEGIDKMVLGHAASNVKISLHYRTSNGQDVEVGRRAKLAKPAVDQLMPFDGEQGTQAFNAIQSVWQHVKDSTTTE